MHVCRSLRRERSGLNAEIFALRIAQKMRSGLCGQREFAGRLPPRWAFALSRGFQRRQPNRGRRKPIGYPWRLVGFVGFFFVDVGGNNRRGENHADKGQSNQKVVHRVSLLVGLQESAHN